MRALDFLSDSPKNYIFQKKAHKTNFGGILFLLYCIIMTIISLSYILDFALNDKYEVEYLRIENQTLGEDLAALDGDPNYNPTLTFNLVITKPFSKKFKIYYRQNGKVYIKDFFDCFYVSLNKPGKCFSLDSKVSDLDFSVFYFCGNDSKCSINDEDSSISENTIIEFNFEIPLGKIDHQNNLKPILDDKIVNEIILLPSNFKTLISLILEWKVIIYKEKKGISRLLDKLFDTKTEYYTGSYNFGELNPSQNHIYKIGKEYYLSLYDISIQNLHQIYDEYKRKKITELDVLSKISALFLPIRLIFIFIYQFYSKNFDNYKLIETILQNSNKEIRIKSKNEINERLFKDSITHDNTNINNSKNSTPLIEFKSVDNETDKTDEELNINNYNHEDDKFTSNESDRILPNYSFIQYFFNNIYCKKCRKSKKQEILNLCNDISKKYMSVDSIMYNQMILENLLKDYKWNNPNLNSIKNIELIYKLKQVIKTEGMLQ